MNKIVKRALVVILVIFVIIAAVLTLKLAVIDYTADKHSQGAVTDASSEKVVYEDDVTTGFKRDIAVSKSFPELLMRRMNDDGVYETPFGSADVAPIIGKIGLGVETNELYTDFEQGSFKQTSTHTDMALSGEGFFAVETPSGVFRKRHGAHRPL